MLGELTGEEIDGLLRSEAVGRIGCYGFGRPYVVPVTYAYDGIAVYCHSREGLKLRMMRGHPTVCFEVDRVDGISDWRSVIATGRFSELEAMEAEFAMQLLQRRIGPLHHPAWARIATTRIAPLVPSATSAPDSRIHPSGHPWSVFRIVLVERSGRFERSDPHLT